VKKLRLSFYAWKKNEKTASFFAQVVFPLECLSLKKREKSYQKCFFWIVFKFLIA